MSATAEKDQTAKDTKEPKGEKKERKVSDFRILVRQKGADVWTPIAETYAGVTQDDAKRASARALAEHPDYGPIIQGDGLELVAVSARSFKPIVVKVEPQPAKLVLK